MTKEREGIEEIIEAVPRRVKVDPLWNSWLRQSIHQELQKAREETTEEIIADYMEALGTVQLPQEVWLWIADINGKYLNKNLKENI